MQWNEWGFRPHLCAYKLNWASRPFWEWWDEWYDTAIQTQDSKCEPWRSEAELLHLGHGWSKQNKILRVSGEETFCFFETWRSERGSSPPSTTFQAGSFNHCTRVPAGRSVEIWRQIYVIIQDLLSKKGADFIIVDYCYILLKYTLNNIGSLEGTLQYYHHAWWLYWRVLFK